MALIGRLGADDFTYMYLRCDKKGCEKEQIIEGIRIHKGQRMQVAPTDFEYPSGWCQVAITTAKLELAYDACCISHGAALFLTRLQDAYSGVMRPNGLLN